MKSSKDSSWADVAVPLNIVILFIFIQNINLVVEFLAPIALLPP